MKKRGIYISACAITAVTAFIFSNSLKVPAETHADSGFIINMIMPFVNRFFEVSYEQLNFIVRKSAHLIEFSWLGISAAVFLYFVKKETEKLFYGSGLFYILLTGVIDEFIQSFTARTSSVSDVLIDFTGGLAGLCLSAVLLGAGRKILLKKQTEKNKKAQSFV